MKNTFFATVIVLLVIIASTQRGCLGPKNEDKPPVIKTVVDTLWQKYDSIVIKKVPVLKEIPADPQYIPQIPEDYETLKSEYSKLLALYYSKKLYQDSIAVGTFGYIHVFDTVNQNSLGQRKTIDAFQIPIVKETTTITEFRKPTRQFYVGGGVNGSQNEGLLGAEAGVMYKTRRDQMLGVKVNVGVNGATSFGVNYYTKIQLKK
jgi:hypothetical protein